MLADINIAGKLHAADLQGRHPVGHQVSYNNARDKAYAKAFFNSQRNGFGVPDGQVGSCKRPDPESCATAYRQ